MQYSKRHLALLTIPILGILGFFYYRNSYTVFDPIIFQPENNAYKTIKADSIFYSNLAGVLSYYNEPYKVDRSGRVFIQRKLKSDRDLVYNYTRKALDIEWLADHQR
jgi:hypothetical protein